MDRQVRRSMVEPDRTDLSVVRQRRLLSIGRSTFYAPPQGESDENLALMAEIDRQFLDTPFYGVRQMTWHLQAKGWPVERQAGSPLDEKDGVDADLPAPENQHAGAWPQDLPVSAARSDDRAAQPGLVYRSECAVTAREDCMT